MNYNTKKIEKSRVEIRIELTEEEIKQYQKKSLDKIADKIEEPGFRKGKAPISVIEKKYSNILEEEIIEMLLKDNYENIITSENIKPISTVNVSKVDLKNDKVIILNVDVYPEIELGKYKDLDVNKENVNVSNELINKEIDSILKREVKQESAEEGYLSQMGDIVDLAFEGFIDNKAFEGGKSESHQLKLGSKTFIGDFEEQLVGYKKGYEGEVNVSFPETYHVKELASKPAMFKIKINEIKKEITPELTEEFAVEHGYESIEDFKVKIEKDLHKREEERVQNEYKGLLLKKVLETTTIEIPDTMINREIQSRLYEMEQQLKQQGLNMNTYLKMSNLTIEKINKELAPMAIEKIKTDLTLNAIAEKEKIDISELELNKNTEKVAKMYQMTVEKLTEELNKVGNYEVFIENIKADTKINKTIEFLVENSKN